MFIVQAPEVSYTMLKFVGKNNGDIMKRLRHPLLPSASLGYVTPGNTKGGSITVPVASCLIGLELSV